MLSALILPVRSYPAMPLARQLEHQRHVNPGPLVLRINLEETPLFAQLLPFANRMNDKVQLVNALAFTFIMGFSIFGIALWKLSGLT